MRYAEYQDVFQSSVATLKLREINVEDDIDEEQDIGVLFKIIYFRL